MLPEVTPVKRGTEVTCLMTLTDDKDQEVWQTRCTYLVMHKQTKTVAERPAEEDVSSLPVLKSEQWKLPADLGRAYGGGMRVSVRARLTTRGGWRSMCVCVCRCVGACVCRSTADDS